MAECLVLMRHLRPPASYRGRLIGATDVPLAPVGQAHAQALAGQVLRLAPHACYCSPMQRCRQTAQAVASELPLYVENGLREIDFGQWENRTFAEAAAADPALVDRWASFDPAFGFPDGEKVGDFLNRVYAIADRLVHAPFRTVLAVTHGGVMRTMICRLLGIEPRKYVAFEVAYGAMAVIDVFDGKGVLRELRPPDFINLSSGTSEVCETSEVCSRDRLKPVESRHG